jgi:hypothetical protein
LGLRFKNNDFKTCDLKTVIFKNAMNCLVKSQFDI